MCRHARHREQEIPKQLGMKMAKLGYTPHLPIILIPGMASSALAVEEGHREWEGERIWISLGKLSTQRVRNLFTNGSYNPNDRKSIRGTYEGMYDSVRSSRSMPVRTSSSASSIPSFVGTIKSSESVESFGRLTHTESSSTMTSEASSESGSPDISPPIIRRGSLGSSSIRHASELEAALMREEQQGYAVCIRVQCTLLKRCVLTLITESLAASYDYGR